MLENFRDANDVGIIPKACPTNPSSSQYSKFQSISHHKNIQIVLLHMLLEAIFLVLLPFENKRKIKF